MTRTRTIVLVAAFGACSGKPTPAPPTLTIAQWDTAAAQEARAAVEKTGNVFASQDLDGLEATLAPDGTIASFELDLDGEPVRSDRATTASRTAK
jgi:hypothetical protein